MKILPHTLLANDPNGVAEMLKLPMEERLRALNQLQGSLRRLAEQPWPPVLDFRTAHYAHKPPVPPLPDAVFEALLRLPVGAPLPDEYIQYFVTDGPAHAAAVSE